MYSRFPRIGHDMQKGTSHRLNGKGSFLNIPRHPDRVRHTKASDYPVAEHWRGVKLVSCQRGISNPHISGSFENHRKFRPTSIHSEVHNPPNAAKGIETNRSFRVLAPPQTNTCIPLKLEGDVLLVVTSICRELRGT